MVLRLQNVIDIKEEQIELLLQHIKYLFEGIYDIKMHNRIYLSSSVRFWNIFCSKILFNKSQARHLNYL